ncbi:hypothetical protein acdb102_06890 [Acidothermaceae bacterium B102]|nr:hypothetical protein acdb102_06890 [Acidothermaceae bacterium B102]
MRGMQGRVGHSSTTPGVIITTSGRSRRSFRAPLRVLAALATALSLMAGVTPAQAATHKATSKLTAVLSPTTVLPHSAATIAGTVTPRGTGVVVLQRYVKGAWVQISHKTAGKTGAYTFTVKTSTALGTSYYRVLRGGSSKATAVTGKSLHLRTVKTAYLLSAASRPAVAAGSPVVVTGTVAHKATGFVMLEMLQHGVWKDMWTGKLTKKSTFSFSHVLATGVYAIRVRKPASATIASGVSKAVKVTVTAPAAAPTAAITLSGVPNGTGVYSGPVTATVTTTAPAGVKSLTYALDGAAAKSYTAPLVVSTTGVHSLLVTVTDTAGRTASATSSWTISSLQAQPVLPTAVVTLVGTLSTGSNYIGNVSFSIAASDVGGPGVASVSYTLDSDVVVPYTGGSVVSTAMHAHTLTVTVTDTAGTIGTVVTTWSQTASVDKTPPTGSISLSGSLVSGSTYSGAVTVTINSADAGSGVGSVTYTLDGAPGTYTGPLSVVASGSHTLVATITDIALNHITVTRTWTQQPIAGGGSDIVVSSADQATLGLPTARLVFSSYIGNATAVPAKQFTFTNTTNKTLAVSNIAIGGTNPGSYGLASASSFSLAPGGSALVSVVFHPVAPSGCPTPADTTAIGTNVAQVATLTYTTNDGGQPSGSADLSGVNACFQGGNGEPVFDQVIAGLGYTTQVDSYTNRRFIGPLRFLPGTDEIQSPYFVAANAAAPVSLVPLAHYATGNTAPAGYQSTGWYAFGAAMNPAKSTCSAACNQLFNFPADPSTTSYNQNQRLLPAQVGGTTFTPGGTFGLFSGDFTDVNFSDDGLDVGHTNDGTNADLPVPHYLHDMRVFQAYGPGHVAIANTYLIGLDINRVPAFKNNDYQDLVFLLSNARPAVAQGPIISGTNAIDLTAIGSIGANCAVPGFDGVLDNACVPGNLHASGAGLAITSTPGQLATNNQANALYKTFDATRGPFTVTARVAGGINQLTTNYQQIGAFFGTDQNNFIKIEIEHNGTGTPHMTMFFRTNAGAGQSVTTIQPSGLTTASTVDLVIKGNTTLPDPIPFGDTYGVSGYPLDQLGVYYSIDGGPLTQLGTTFEYPANVPGFFSRSSKAGILDSNSGTPTTLTATFSRFSISNS